MDDNHVCKRLLDNRWTTDNVFDVLDLKKKKTKGKRRLCQPGCGGPHLHRHSPPRRHSDGAPLFETQPRTGRHDVVRWSTSLSEKTHSAGFVCLFLLCEHDGTEAGPGLFFLRFLRSDLLNHCSSVFKSINPLL